MKKAINASLILKQQNTKYIENESNKTLTIDKLPLGSLLYIRKCNSSIIAVNTNTKIAKIVIDSCSKSQIIINADLLTCTVEVIHCDQVDIHFNKESIHTLTVDNSKKCNFQFTPVNNVLPHVYVISNASCEDCTIALPDRETRKSYSKYLMEHKISKNVSKGKVGLQFRHHFKKNCNGIISEQIIREGAGYITTEKEKKINDEKMRIMNKRMEEMALKSVNFGKKNQPTLDLPKQVPLSEKKRVKEYFDDFETVKICVKKLAELIKNAKHCVVYTGAGISTSAKIPDYRGPNGIWTMRDQGKEVKRIDIEQAWPTFAHYSLVEMMKKGYIKHIVSTNIDGLHRRSGISSQDISELHGNCYREYCSKCGKEYLRGFDVCKSVKKPLEHITGRKCDDCGGDLKDTIVHFGEELPEKELNKAIMHSKKTDLALVVGTSMIVAPANELPMQNYSNGAILVIVNLQKTRYDSKAHLRLFCKTDDLFKLLTKELGINNVDTSYDALQA